MLVEDKQDEIISGIKTKLWFKAEGKEEAFIDVKIHINTLEAFNGHGAGNYELSSMKVMTTTHDFLALSEDERGCQIG